MAQERSSVANFEQTSMGALGARVLIAELAVLLGIGIYSISNVLAPTLIASTVDPLTNLLIIGGLVGTAVVVSIANFVFELIYYRGHTKARRTRVWILALVAIAGAIGITFIWWLAILFVGIMGLPAWVLSERNLFLSLRTRRRAKIFVAIGIIGLGLLGSSAIAFYVNADTYLTTSYVPVGAVLYLWYSARPNAVAGWNSTSSPGGGATVDVPSTGYYTSDNTSTFATQIREMQSAGISFAVVSWWGWGGGTENDAINQATFDLFNYLRATHSTFKVALMVDAYTDAPNYKAIYTYVYDQFAGPYSQWYFNWQGKPLLLFFNPLYPSYDNSSFTVRTIGNRPNPVEWIFWDAPSNFFVGQAGSGVNHNDDLGTPVVANSPLAVDPFGVNDGEVTIVPRIDSYFNYKENYQGGYMRFDPSLGMGLYQEEWKSARAQHAKLVIIYSWNEYHERTEIEPHTDYTAKNLSSDYLLNITATYASELPGH